MFKKTIFVLLATVMVLIMIPLYNVYAAPSPSVMINYQMTNSGNHTFSLTHYFNEVSKPDYDGPVYDNPNNDGNIGSSGWYQDTIDGRSVVRPGHKKHACFGFSVDLEKHYMLGAAIKGQLKAKSNIFYDNYKGDDDTGKPIITSYNSSNGMIANHEGTWHSVSNWINNEVTIDVPRNAKYLIFGGMGERDGGFLNKNMDFNVNNVSGYIWDNTPPEIIRIENDQPHKSPDQEKLTENAIKKEPYLYITMSEDCYFNYMTVKLTDTEGHSAVVGLKKENSGTMNYSNGDVTYKFRILTEQLNGLQNHFINVALNTVTITDTFGNYTNSTKNLSCNKRIDTKPATIEIGPTPNTFIVKDAFGLSKITKTFKINSINNSKDALNVGGDIFVKDAITNSSNNATLNEELAIINNTAITGIFDVKLDVWDLVKNYSSYNQKLFMISNSEPVKLKLANSNNASFAFEAQDFDKNTVNAVTNMTLKTDISPDRLYGAKIYYKWDANNNSSILSQNIDSSWSSVKFQNNSSETEQISIPVALKTDGLGNYLAPAYNKGYLYIMPFLDDDTTVNATLRTGSMAIAANNIDTGGLFDLVDSKPVKGEFVNRCCSCTGQACNEDAVSHYGAIGNHNKAIGFNITENLNSLTSIKYFIKNSENSYIAQGTINKNDSGQYDIPITDIMGKTGNYTVTVALYSNKGDVTVQNINVNIESPVISISNIMHNQATQNLDFTVSYNRNSIIAGNLEDVQLEICDESINEFKEFKNDESDKLSLYAITEGSVIAKDKWDAEIGDKVFIRSEFVPDPQNPERMKADFRASLTNMVNAGDQFVKNPGAKRVHVKYTTSNKVEVFNNNITVIKKSNIPPSINLMSGVEGSYFTKYTNDTSTSSAIKVKIVEPVIEMNRAYYKWAESANTSLINADGTIDGTTLNAEKTKTKTIDFTPGDIPAVTGDILYKPYYLIVYAENTSGKYVEKSFGPFYVLNDDINNKRFNITATDKALGDMKVLISIDDNLHMIDQLPKADKLKVIWQKDKVTVAKTYDICFIKDGLSSNVSVINVPYIELTDTDRVGGTFKLSKIEIYNSSDEVNILKTVNTDNIVQVLPEYFVTINYLTDNNGTYGANVKSDKDELSYQWAINPYEVPIAWTTTNGAIGGINFVPDTKMSLINKSIYLFVKERDKVYRSEKIDLKTPVLAETITDVTVKIGELLDGYYGTENGTKKYVPIRIVLKSKDDFKKIAKVDVYDQFSVTSGTAISVANLYKISETEVAGLIPSLVTSNSAISCKVSINGIDTGKVINSENRGTDVNILKSEQSNRIISITDITDYLKYNLYQKDGKSYSFDAKGKTEIYTAGDYLLVYHDAVNFYAKEISLNSIGYTADDIKTTFSPDKPTEGKISDTVTATITMPYGSIINDKYGIISNVETLGNKVVATAVVTRSAIYTFDVQFASNQKIEHKVDLSYIAENYKPVISTITSSTAITYTPAGPAVTKDNVTADLNLEGLNLLNNKYLNSYVYDKNGKFSFIAKDKSGNLYEYVSEVDWIDKSCPEPTVKKYVWNDYNQDGKYDLGEKGSEIPKGYKTKYNVLVEITFPHNSNLDRPVKISDATGFTAEDLSVSAGYAYKYVMVYKPIDENSTIYRKMLGFSDTLANTLNCILIIDEIDKTPLLTQLNYSTTEFTNRDVVVSMSANKPIKRYDNVTETDELKNTKIVKKDASPTYVFKQNGEKDFNYEKIEVVEGEEVQGILKAVVSWIDKSVPLVKTEYSNQATNKSVEIKFTVIKGVEQNAKLRYGLDLITLTDDGGNRVGTYNVNENGNYNFEVINKYGTIGDVIVPIYNIDKTAPELNIYGREHVYIKVNDKYYDKGASAYDNKDGNVTEGIKVSSNVNSSVTTKGKPYEVVYSIMDASGNVSTKTRYVHVLDITSSVVIVNDNVIDLNSQQIHDVKLANLGQINVEFIGIDGNYTVKYARGEGFDNAYFKTNGSYISKYGTFTVQEGKYVLHVQDQERNTRMITINFIK